MTSKQTSMFTFAWLPGEQDFVPAGELTLTEEGINPVTSEFVYGTRYVRRPNAFEVDPVALKFLDNPPTEPTRFTPLEGHALFGAFRDAAPDFWGRRVIENKLRSPGQLPESVYLLHAGPNRTGALDFRLRRDSPALRGAHTEFRDLDYLMEAVERVEEGLPIPSNLEMLFDAGPSMGGARPKAVIQNDGSQWVAKFPSRTDPYNVPRIEQATLKLAAEAGLNVPRLDCVRIADGRDVMLIERFDRQRNGDSYERKHFVSALTLLRKWETESQYTSYSEIAQAIAEHGVQGKIDEDRQELFGRMIFNILVTNDDDHLRNHGFLWDNEGQGWRLSPLYDVVPKPQLATDRNLHLIVGEQGRLARIDNAMTNYGVFGLNKDEAIAIIDRINRVVREWKNYYETSGVDGREITKIESAFRKAKELGG